MASKLRIKFGTVEFEYEGQAEFDREAIKDLFTHMEALFSASTGTTNGYEAPLAIASSVAPTGAPVANGHTVPVLHINSVASRLDVETGPDLAMASAAYLQLVLGQPSFTRTELLETMKAATASYKQAMSGNLSKILVTLVSNKRLNQLGANTYGLPHTEREAYGARLA